MRLPTRIRNTTGCAAATQWSSRQWSPSTATATTTIAAGVGCVCIAGRSTSGGGTGWSLWALHLHPQLVVRSLLSCERNTELTVFRCFLPEGCLHLLHGVLELLDVRRCLVLC